MISRISLLSFLILIIRCSNIHSTMPLSEAFYQEQMSYMRIQGESVYQVNAMASDQTGWSGTGFVITTKSGRNVIITNKHVCAGAQTLSLYREHSDKERFSKGGIVEIIEISKIHDLCMLTAPLDAIPLKLATKIEINEQTFLVGYPQIDRMTMTTGYYKGSQYVQDLMGNDRDEDAGDETAMRRFCTDSQVYTMVLNDRIPGRFICRLEGEVVNSTTLSGPGASGSAITDINHDVVAVVFAGPTEGIPMATCVPQSYLKAFLDKH